jgi:hypothetical protein
MPARKRPLDRKNRRVTIEVYAAEEQLWHRARMAALAAHMTLREWVTETVEARLDWEAAQEGREGQLRDA